MRKLIILFALGFAFLCNDVQNGVVKSACADGPYCAERTFKCRDRDGGDGFVCCSTEDNSRCCHYKNSGVAYCAYSCD